MGKVCVSCGGDVAMPKLEEAEDEKCENCEADDEMEMDDDMEDGDEMDGEDEESDEDEEDDM